MKNKLIAIINVQSDDALLQILYKVSVGYLISQSQEKNHLDRNLEQKSTVSK